jgi:hypothetical protein
VGLPAPVPLIPLEHAETVSADALLARLLRRGRYNVRHTHARYNHLQIHDHLRRTAIRFVSNRFPSGPVELRD